MQCKITIYKWPYDFNCSLVTNTEEFLHVFMQLLTLHHLICYTPLLSINWGNWHHEVFSVTMLEMLRHIDGHLTTLVIRAFGITRFYKLTICRKVL